MCAGNAKSMLVTNCLFRLGGVAALLSNRPGDARAAKYRLDHVVRTHLGADPTAYKCAPYAKICAQVPGVRTVASTGIMSCACAQHGSRSTVLFSIELRLLSLHASVHSTAHPSQLVCGPERLRSSAKLLRLS